MFLEVVEGAEGADGKMAGTEGKVVGVAGGGGEVARESMETKRGAEKDDGEEGME